MKRKFIAIITICIIASSFSLRSAMAQQVDVKESQQLLEAIKEQGLSVPEAINYIQNRNCQISTEQNTLFKEIVLTVDYSRSLEDMVAAGKYDWVSSIITEEHFPIPNELVGKKVTISGKLFHFDRDISSEEAIKEMNKDGYRTPRHLAEFLALGEAYPDPQCQQFSIIALGPVWHNTVGSRCVPELIVSGSLRELRLYWFDVDWGASCRFFGVRK